MQVFQPAQNLIREILVVFIVEFLVALDDVGEVALHEL